MDKEKFYNKVDSVPLVRMLQVAAVVILILSILQIALSTLPAIFSGYAVLGGSFALITQLAQAIITPLILLSLAEIIKLLRK